MHYAHALFVVVAIVVIIYHLSKTPPPSFPRLSLPVDTCQRYGIVDSLNWNVSRFNLKTIGKFL